MPVVAQDGFGIWSGTVPGGETVPGLSGSLDVAVLYCSLLSVFIFNSSDSPLFLFLPPI